MMKRLGIYIHIPFCLSKCRYCGFYSRGGADEGEMGRYAASLADDIKEYGKVYGKIPGRGCNDSGHEDPALDGRDHAGTGCEDSALDGRDCEDPGREDPGYTVDTVFIGGGTPSILPPGAVSSLMDSLRSAFDIEADAEITIESNPKTLTREKLLEYRRAGIDRLSMGLQSFDDGCLRTLGRVHTAEDFLENFRLARECGFDNINIDLMFAIPGHTMEIWEDTLERAVGLSPEHISFYSLQIEEGTPFYEMFRRGEIDQIPDETDRLMYHRAIAVLKEAGYEHYEISNAAKPGRQCRHNLKYWSMEDYLGIGSGASSFVNGVRFAEAPLMEFHENDFDDTAGEFVFTGLRKTRGIRFDEFRALTGRDFWDVFADRRGELARFFAAGQLVETADGLRLSEAGIDISNAIMAVFV